MIFTPVLAKILDYPQKWEKYILLVELQGKTLLPQAAEFFFMNGYQACLSSRK
jgi:hypothetical protein